VDSILAETDAWILALILAVAMSAAWRVGWWLGNGLRARCGDYEGSKFDDASLAFVGLLLAFTFGMSLAKHDHRRDMVVADSNAIGDFYTCASMLKEPVQTKLQTVIRDCLVLRVEMSRKRIDHAALEELLRRSQQMQAQMTDLAVEAVNEGTPIAVSLTNALNALTSNHAARLAAAKDRLPAKHRGAAVRLRHHVVDAGRARAGAGEQARSRRYLKLHPVGDFSRLRHAGPKSTTNWHGHC
jgi:hypothetical protein